MSFYIFMYFPNLGNGHSSHLLVSLASRDHPIAYVYQLVIGALGGMCVKSYAH